MKEDTNEVEINKSNCWGKDIAKCSKGISNTTVIRSISADVTISRGAPISSPTVLDNPCIRSVPNQENSVADICRDIAIVASTSQDVISCIGSVGEKITRVDANHYWSF